MSRAERYAKWIIGHKWRVMLGAVMLVAVAGAGLKNAYVNGRYEVYFDEGSARLSAFRDLEATYTKEDSVTFMVEAPSGSVFDRHVLNVIAALTEDAWQLPQSRRVESLTNFSYVRSQGDDLLVSDLFENPVVLTDRQITERRDFARTEPMIQRALLSVDESVTQIVTTVLQPEADPAVNATVANAAQELRDRYAMAYPDLIFRLSGTTIVNQAFVDGSVHEQGRLMIVMYLVMLVVVGLLLRSVTAALATALMVLLSVVAGLGAATWIGFPITGYSSNAPIIVMTLAAANTVHIVSVMLTAMQVNGRRDDALENALVINLTPVFLTSLTTAIAFMCLNTSAIPPQRFLGTTTALGVVAAFGLSYTFLPALLAALPIRVKTRNGPAGKPDIWDTFATWVVGKRIPLLAAMVATVAGTSVFVTNNQLDDSVLTYLSEDHQVRQEAEFGIEHTLGAYNISYSIPAPAGTSISEPEYMAEVARFSDWARRQPEVVHVASLNHTMRRLNMSMHGDDPSRYQLPDDRELAAQYLLLYEMSLPFGRDLTNQVDIGETSTKVTVSFRNISSREMRDFEARADAWMRNNFPPQMFTTGVSVLSMFAHIWDDTIVGNLKGVLLAVILIAVIVAGAMKSLKLGLLSLIPNLFPALMAFGVWGLAVGRVDVGSSVVAVISFGIIVDDTIHFLSKYRHARTTMGATPTDAVRFAFTTVGRALLVTSIALIAGFAMLSQSAFTPNADMGILTGIVIAFALALDFLLLPPLLILMEKKRYAKTQYVPAE